MLPKNYVNGMKRLCIYHHGAGELAYSPFYNPLCANLAAIYPSVSSDEGTAIIDNWGNAASFIVFDALATTFEASGTYPYGKTGTDFRYGVSMGGASALCYAAHNPGTTAAVVSTIPAFNLTNLWSPTTTVAAGSNTGTLSAIASWTTPAAGVLSVVDAIGIITPPGIGPYTFAGTNGAALSTLSTLALNNVTGIPIFYSPGTAAGTIVTNNGTHPFTYTGISGNTLTGCVFSGTQADTVATNAVIAMASPANVITTGGTGSIVYTGVSGNTLTGCVYVNGTGTTVVTGNTVTYSRIQNQPVATGDFKTSINNAYGTYSPAGPDAFYTSATVQASRDVYYMGMNTPQLFSTFPIYLWYGMQDPTCCWKEIEAWALNVNNYCTANSLPPTVTLVADPVGTHASATYNCWYSVGTKLGGSGGTTVSVPFANMNTVLSAFNVLN